MRVEAYNQVTGLYRASKTARVAETQVSVGRDDVQISRSGRDFQVAKKAVKESADVREDKVAQLKAKIDAGEYQVSADDFAAKLMERYQSFYQYL